MNEFTRPRMDGPVRGPLEDILVAVGMDLGTRLTYSGVYLRAEARASRSRVFATEGRPP